MHDDRQLAKCLQEEEDAVKRAQEKSQEESLRAMLQRERYEETKEEQESMRLIRMMQEEDQLMAGAIREANERQSIKLIRQI